MTEKICLKPFNNIEITENGDVYTCCPCYINFHNIGNIFDDRITSFEDIWYSKEAKILREKILNNDFSLCNCEICREAKFIVNDNNKYTIAPDLPETVTLAYDKACNIQCITCRSNMIKNNKETSLKFENKLDSVIIPLLKNAKNITISGSGEALYSTHSRQLIKKLTSTNKTVEFNINTNGLLFNKQNCEELGLVGRINNVFVSMHAFHKPIYNRIMVGSDLETVIKNIKYISELQKEHSIKLATINCVISDINYTEIPYMIEFAQKLDLWISFSIYTPWGADLDKKYEELSVWKPTHKHYKHFTDVIKQAKNIEYRKCNFAPAIENVH